jgi:hypothetical protein
MVEITSSQGICGLVDFKPRRRANGDDVNRPAQLVRTITTQYAPTITSHSMGMLTEKISGLDVGRIAGRLTLEQTRHKRWDRIEKISNLKGLLAFEVAAN